MYKEETLAYVNAMTACALIEAAGLTAENQSRLAAGHTFGFNGPAEFAAIIEKYGIHHNAVLSTLRSAT